MKLLFLFIVLSVINVILQTFKSIATIKCGKINAAIVNACAYGLYTVVIVYTNADFPLWEKVLVTAFCNLVGVFVVKSVEEKARKDKLWLVKITIKEIFTDEVERRLNEENISHSVIRINGYKVFDCYCSHQDDTKKVLKIAKTFHGKTFATENKLF